MAAGQTVLHGVDLESSRVHPLLYDEFNAFQADFEVETESRRQYMRGAFLAWFLTFTPELFPPDLVTETATFVDAVTDRASYRTFGWHNVLHLRAALFAYTGQGDWITDVLGNLAHHNSSLRIAVAEALATVVDRLDATDPVLLEQIGHNLDSMHFFNELSLLLFVAASGPPEFKLARLRRWREDPPEAGSGREMIEDLITGSAVGNPFSATFRDTERYVLLRLCTTPAVFPIQLVGRGRGGADVLREPLARNVRVDAGEVLARLGRHPLGGGQFRLALATAPGLRGPS